jgi:hypothetical protein
MIIQRRNREPNAPCAYHTEVVVTKLSEGLYVKAAYIWYNGERQS